MQRLKIDCLKFLGATRFKSRDGTEHVAIPLATNNIFVGEKGLYLEISLLDNRDGADKYGNHGFATVDLGKARREAKERGPILGNWTWIGTPPASPATAPAPNPYAPRTAASPAPAPAIDEDPDGIPF